MNYIKHLTGFFERVAMDKSLNPTHISLYMSLFQFWNCNRFRNPISINRDELMRISKISSKATYHKCLKNLHAQDYIKYEPSYNPFRGSHVSLYNFADDLKPQPKTEKTASLIFEPVGEQVLNEQQTGNKQAAGQALVPPINNTNKKNNSNSLNWDKPAKKTGVDHLAFKNENVEEKEKGSAEKEKPQSSVVVNPLEVVPQLNSDFPVSDEKLPVTIHESSTTGPVIQQVLEYFLEQGYPELEANKFFNYFKSVGWLVGGKIPMADWTSAARNWILNAPKYTITAPQSQSKNLNTGTEKDYAEPL